jgi:2-oxoglutarate ferredoxin oxidoreductase subunit alpha
MMEPVVTEHLPRIQAPQKEWAVRGKGKNPRKVIKVAPHTDEELIDWNRKLKQKYQRIKENEQRHEALFTKDAELVVVAFGSTARIALDAVLRARDAGMAVGMFRPISLFPYPQKALNKMVRQGTRKLLVVEANNGQMVEDVRLAVCGSAEVTHYGFGGGHIFSPDEIYREICRFGKSRSIRA